MRALRARTVLRLVDAVAMVFMVMLALAVPARAAAAPPAQAPPAAPGRELAGLRTATSRTFEVSGGLRRTRLYGAPVNFRQGDRWKAIDNTLVAADRAGFVHGRGNDGDALIPTDLSKPLTVRRDGRWVSLSLRDAKGSAQLRGSHARFADALSGVDATYAATNTGLKETLTLKGAGATSTFSYDVQASAGLSPRRTADGAVAFADQGGRDRFVLTPPVAWDSSSSAATTHAVDMAIDAAGDGWRLTVSVDRLWLASSHRRFPVTVDPNIQWLVGGTMRYSGAQRDCTLSSAAPAASLVRPIHTAANIG